MIGPAAESTEMGRRAFWGLVLVTVLVVLATRWPHQSAFLFNWDSANFALAVERIDIAAHRPHPPGYLGYVFAARALLPLFGDINAALVAWNILVTILAVVLASVFAWESAAPEQRPIASAAVWTILVTSPLVWFHGEVAEIYISEMFWSIAIAFLAWRAIEGRGRALVWCAAAVAGAILFKLTVAVFTTPLVIYAAWRSSLAERRSAALVLIIGVALVAGFFFAVEPGIVGITWSQFTTATTGSRLVDGASGLRSFNRNLRDTLTSAIQALGVINTLALLAWALASRRAAGRIPGRVALLWVLPWLAFLLFVHIGRPGYVLPLLPVAALLLGSFYARGGPGFAATILVLSGILNAAQFLVLRPFSDEATGGTQGYREKSALQRLASDAQPVTFATSSTIATADASLSRLQQAVRDLCPGGDVVIVAGEFPVEWRRVMWFHPRARAVYVEGERAVYMAQDREFAVVPPAGVTLTSACPVIWLAPERGPGGATPTSFTRAALPGLGWTTPAGGALRVSPSGISPAP